MMTFLTARLARRFRIRRSVRLGADMPEALLRDIGLTRAAMEAAELFGGPRRRRG